MTRTNWDGTPADVAEIRARRLGGDPCGIEIGWDARRGVVTSQVIGPRGGLSDMYTLTPDNARAMADVLAQCADRVETQEAPPPGVEIAVDSETFDAIAQMIESPPEPTRELKRLMRANAPWDDASEQKGEQP